MPLSSWFLLDGFAKVSFIPRLTPSSLGACFSLEEPLPFLGGLLGDADYSGLEGHWVSQSRAKPHAASDLSHSSPPPAKRGCSPCSP